MLIYENLLKTSLLTERWQPIRLPRWPFCLHAGFAATLATPVRLGTSASLLVRMTSPRGPFYRTGDDSCLLCDKPYF